MSQYRDIPTKKMTFDEIDSTLSFGNELHLQIMFEGNKEIYKSFPSHKENITIGRNSDNDVYIPSIYVSGQHGVLPQNNGTWFYENLSLTNGTRFNNESQSIVGKRIVNPSDVLIIDYPGCEIQDSVRIRVLDKHKSLRSYELSKKNQYTIGRALNCDIRLDHIAVSNVHAMLNRNGIGEFEIIDNSSTNGIIVNNQSINRKTTLKTGDMIQIVGFQILYLSDAKSQRLEIQFNLKNGYSLRLENVSKQISEWKNENGAIPSLFRKKNKVLLDNVSLSINPGEMIAIVGGSGAGKTTLLNAICGFDSNVSGCVYVNGQSLRDNFEKMKEMIGYVPQQDIVYDNLKLIHMLQYAAKMRMLSDTTRTERNRRINEILDIVGLSEHRNKYIRKLSGGQKKRAADPKLFFLDEPMSGLDPGIEEELMTTLHNLSRDGKTILMVTHSTLQLKQCDKVIVMGKGGKLCYFGNSHEMLTYFDVDNIPALYPKLDDMGSAQFYQNKCRNILQNKEGFQSYTLITKANQEIVQNNNKRNSTLHDFSILTRRYFRIIFSSAKQLFSIFWQPLLFSIILTALSDANLYKMFSATQTVSFINACLGMWMGLFLAIDEIRKERGILRRENMAGIGFTPYILSKVVVLSFIIFLQSCMLEACSYGSAIILSKNLLPKYGVILPVLLENTISITLIGIASICMGLFISASSKQPERLAPYVLMPQIVLSGVLFNLGTGFEYISKLVITYWGNRAICSTLNINDLPVIAATEYSAAQFKNPVVEGYARTTHNLLNVWGALIALSLFFALLCRLSLNKLPHEER